MDAWRHELGVALASGDAGYMHAMLERVPLAVLREAAPGLARWARQCEQEGRLEECLVCLGVLIRALPDSVALRSDRVRVLLALGRSTEALADAQAVYALEPDAPAALRLLGMVRAACGEGAEALAAFRALLQRTPADAWVAGQIASLEAGLRGAPAQDTAVPAQAAAGDAVAVDPAWFDDPGMPAALGPFRVEGLQQHLLRYSGQRSATAAIARLEHPAWRAAWDEALAALRGRHVLLWGSELGVFALRARQHGAASVTAVEAHPLDARIAGGIVHKHLLAHWRAACGEGARGWSEAAQRESFEAFAQNMAVLSDADPIERPVDAIVFTRFDHSLLGTGVVRALARYREQHGALPAVLLPARARLYAAAISWQYPGAGLRLEPLNRMRWGLYPQVLDGGQADWCALTEVVCVATIDFADFSPVRTRITLPVVRDGQADAIMFWYALDLGVVTLDSAPDRPDGPLRPAVQQIEPVPVQQGDGLVLQARIDESRIHFHTAVPAGTVFTHSVPAWLARSVTDAVRLEAYRAAIVRVLAQSPVETAVDVGAGVGLVAMAAVSAGVHRVLAYEAHAALLAAAQDVVALNGCADRIRFEGRDCRQAVPPEASSGRADLLILEAFDCSLIGEGVLRYLAFARTQLLADSARILPRGGRLRGQLVEYRLDRLWDIDVNLLNAFRAPPAFINVDAATLDYRPLSDSFDLFGFDFSSATPAADERRLELPILDEGVVGAVLFWFDIELDEGCWLSNDPAQAATSHWKQGLQLVPEVQVSAGMSVPLVVQHDGSTLQCRWDRDSLPPGIVSRLPRWDPRWLAAHQDLEARTRQLLQHCAQDRSEQAAVAQIAARMAIDPARYGLDPQVAQRFAEMMLQG